METLSNALLREVKEIRTELDNKISASWEVRQVRLAERASENMHAKSAAGLYNRMFGGNIDHALRIEMATLRIMVFTKMR